MLAVSLARLVEQRTSCDTGGMVRDGQVKIIAPHIYSSYDVRNICRSTTYHTKTNQAAISYE